MIKVLELFAGYGSQALALENLGLDFTSDISEIDKYAIDAYNQIHGQTKNYGDICGIDETELPEYDLITYSSPCQDFSIAGLQRGGDKDSGTRSSLLWECERIIRSVKPKYLLMENVKNLVGKKFMPCFDAWLRTLEEIGYNNYWKVLNAKDYGVPQNRERVFVVSIRKDLNQTYMFPEPVPLKMRLKDLLESEVDEKYYLPQEKVEQLALNGGSLDGKHTWDVVCCASRGRGEDKKQQIELNKTLTTNTLTSVQKDNLILQIGNIFNTDSFGGNPQAGRVYDAKGLSPCLNTMEGGERQPKVLEGIRIRRLTPKECWRLMGVKDEQYDRLHGISKTQLYKMAGNSIVVDVLMAILKNLLISDKETKGQLYLL